MHSVFAMHCTWCSKISIYRAPFYGSPHHGTWNIHALACPSRLKPPILMREEAHAAGSAAAPAWLYVAGNGGSLVRRSWLGPGS
jgi:hypothetical protein